MENANKRLKVY